MNAALDVKYVLVGEVILFEKYPTLINKIIINVINLRDSCVM